MDLLALLGCKNQALKQYWDLSVSFLAKIEESDHEERRRILERETQRFHSERETILSFIGFVDKRTQETVTFEWIEAQGGLTGETVRRLRELETERIATVREIVKLDEILIRRIEMENKITQEQLSKTRRSKEALQSFKSDWAHSSGESFDEKAT